jgi:hypothetical protein
MPTFQEVNVLITLTRENTGSRILTREKVNVESPVSACSIRTAVESLAKGTFEGWFLAEYQTV